MSLSLSWSAEFTPHYDTTNTATLNRDARWGSLAVDDGFSPRKVRLTVDELRELATAATGIADQIEASA